MNKHDSSDGPPPGAGIGVLGGGAAAGALGTAFGGPVGGVIGAIVGAFAGGAAARELAEDLDPTEEDAYWRRHFRERPYARGAGYETFRPAYAYGWTTRRAYLDESFAAIEDELRRGWELVTDRVELSWSEARAAVRDGWERVGDSYERMFDEEEAYWRERFRQRPYVMTDSDFETYRPAYRFGMRNRISRWGETFDEIESDLEREWARFHASNTLRFAQARDAIRDGWHHIERRLPGEFDADGR